MVSVKTLITTHSELAVALSFFDLVSAAKLIGGLGTIPVLHANTLRIEILAHLAVACCKGVQSATPDDLHRWLTLLDDSSFARYEDPTEDLFLSCVTTTLGSFRVFQGILADGCFLVERFISFYSGKTSFPTFEETLNNALALAKLSDAIASRLSLPRYCSAGGEPHDKIRIPESLDANDHFSSVTFSIDDLANLRIDPALLKPFILYQSEPGPAVDDFWNEPLDDRPLIQCEGSLVVLVPSALARALVKLMLRRASLMGGWGHTFFLQEAATRFVNDVATRMQIKEISNPPRMESEHFPSLLPVVGWFDVGKAAIMLTYAPRFEGSLSEVDSWSPEEEQAVDEYLRALTHHLERSQHANGGLILLCLAGVGRTMAIVTPNLGKKWFVHVSTLREWEAMTTAGQCSALRLWKLNQHLVKAETYGVEVLNPGGLPNLISFWIENGFRVAPRQVDLREKSFRVMLDCAFAYRCFTKDAELRDEHAVLSPNGASWVRVVRHRQDPLFSDDKPSTVYVDQQSAPKRLLHGCSLADINPWWVFGPDAPQSGENLSLIYQLWDCVLEWVDRIVPQAIASWPSLSGAPVIIQLEMPDVEHWSVEDRAQRPSVPPKLKSSVMSKTRSITLSFDERFLWRFNEPKNVAETMIVEAIVRGSASIAGEKPSSEEMTRIVQQLVRSDGARHFHLTTTFDLEPILLASPYKKPLFVAPEDMTYLQLGLADLVGRPSNGSAFTSSSECINFLKDAVIKVWERLEKRLRQFNHKSVVTGCLGAIDGLTKDEMHWDMTTRSLLALYVDEKATRTVIEQRRSDREQSKLANRLLIETAQYACRQTASQSFNRDDHLLAMADMSVLLMLAAARDAISSGFAEPLITVHPNGEISFDTGFYESVVAQYHSKRSNERTSEAAETYEMHFKNAHPTPKATAKPWTWECHFEVEYGFTINQWLDFILVIRQFAVESGDTFGVLEEKQLIGILRFGAQMSESQAAKFIDRITLPIRSAWNADMPPRCKETDVFPWRFRRNLSSLMRPLIKVAISPPEWIVSAPLLQRSLEYISYNIDEARFPEAFFATAQMRKHIGDTTNHRGHAFAERVAKVVESNGYFIRLEVEMSELGASKKQGLGDVDVLAWEPSSGRVLLIECKRLQVALTMREIMQRLEDFRGDKKELDSLARHVRRVEWLKQNPLKVASLTGIAKDTIKFFSLVVTTGTVPMQFFTGMAIPADTVVPISDLPGFLRQIPVA